jgi:hypothetical protein
MQLLPTKPARYCLTRGMLEAARFAMPSAGMIAQPIFERGL